MQANNQFCQVQIEEKKGFVVADEQLLQGKILSVGQEVVYLKKGDTVLFDKHKALTYPIKGINYWFVREETILAYETKK